MIATAKPVPEQHARMVGSFTLRPAHICICSLHPAQARCRYPRDHHEGNSRPFSIADGPCVAISAPCLPCSRAAVPLRFQIQSSVPAPPLPARTRPVRRRLAGLFNHFVKALLLERLLHGVSARASRPGVRHTFKHSLYSLNSASHTVLGVVLPRRYSGCAIIQLIATTSGALHRCAILSEYHLMKQVS